MTDNSESLLSGGISNSVSEAPIIPVQGGGGLIGGDVNSEISLLDGGIGEIKVVEGGAGDPKENIHILQYENLLDTGQYINFKTQYDENKIKSIRVVDFEETTLHYSESGQTNKPANSTNYIKIKIIPSNIKKLIILPPIVNDPNEPEDQTYIKQIMFLISNKYMKIDVDKNFIIRKNIFVISLSLNIENSYIRYFSYMIKKSNPQLYYILGKEFNAFLYPNKDNSFIVCKKDFKFYKTEEGTMSLDNDNYIQITEKKIKSIQYKPNKTEEYGIDKITDGEDSIDPTATDYSFELGKKIAVISLKDEDIRSINVDLQGKKYRIRIPLRKNESDVIYKSWILEKWMMDEKKLLDDLDIKKPLINIPDFLYNLAYYKCFNDVSLLTKAECSSMKEMLEILYSKALRKATEQKDILS